MFPPDSNPFYAGFGNRDTDEISYLKVGIPKGKIFIINPKVSQGLCAVKEAFYNPFLISLPFVFPSDGLHFQGEVAVNRRVDTKSYTSLHDIVHDIFPVMTSSHEQV